MALLGGGQGGQSTPSSAQRCMVRQINYLEEWGKEGPKWTSSIFHQDLGKPGGGRLGITLLGLAYPLPIL